MLEKSNNPMTLKHNKSEGESCRIADILWLSSFTHIRSLHSFFKSELILKLCIYSLNEKYANCRNTNNLSEKDTTRSNNNKSVMCQAAQAASYQLTACIVGTQQARRAVCCHFKVSGKDRGSMLDTGGIQRFILKLQFPVSESGYRWIQVKWHCLML